jgi:transcription elongation factor GreA
VTLYYKSVSILKHSELYSDTLPKRGDSMDKEKILEKIESLFKEETWGRIDPKDMGISKFKILEDLLNRIVSEGITADIAGNCRDHVKDYPQSITARYLLGIIAYQNNVIDEKIYLKNLIDLFVNNHRWAVAEHISQKILEYGENRFALKTLATALERLSRQREAIPVWEELLKIDRFDSEVAKKLSYAILEDDPEKSTYYMKLSLEAFIKNREFDELAGMWVKLISNSWEDLQFFERIERMLIEAKRKDLACEMLKSLYKKYRDADITIAINILKRVLEYSPEDNHSRNDILRLYREKYADHSQLEQFIRISKIDAARAPVVPAIKSFENIIIFDIGNYVEHRSWGIGKIVSMDSETMIVDFKEKQGHSMSMQMALSSLTPIAKDHIRAVQLDDPEGLKKLLTGQIGEFFKILLSSFGGRLNLAQLKKELIPSFVEQSSWSKWWTKARNELRKNAIFGFDEPKTGDVFIREKPVTYLEVIIDRFRTASSFSEKLDAAEEYANNIEKNEGVNAAQEFVSYFSEAAKSGSKTKLVLSYFALKSLSKFVDEKELGLGEIFKDLSAFIKESDELPLIAMKISSYDNKKEFVTLISTMRKDWVSVLSNILFETPVRIHRYIITMLIRAHAYRDINTFIERIILGAKQMPEIIIWVARSIFSGEWNYEWLDYSKPRLSISLFRMMHELKRIETKGSRLRTMAQELILNNDLAVFAAIVENCDMSLAAKIIVLVKGSDLFTDGQIEKMIAVIKKQCPDFKPEVDAKPAEEIDYEEVIVVTQAGFDKKSAEYNALVNVEMARLQKDLSATSDVSSDVRENVEYNSLMEKQGVLKQAIARLDAELKRAKILDFSLIDDSIVSVGTKVDVESSSGDKLSYRILGPWDADYENGILSYRSPLARSLMKKKAGDEVKVQDGGVTYKIKSIEKIKQ